MHSQSSVISIEQIIAQNRQLSLIISRSRNLGEILHLAVTEIRQLLETDRVLIYRCMGDGRKSVVVESVAPSRESLRGKTLHCRGCETTNLEGDFRVRAIADIHSPTVDPHDREFLAPFPVRAHLWVPLLIPENSSPGNSYFPVSPRHLWGFLMVHQVEEPRSWNNSQKVLLQQIALQLGIAIQQAQLWEQWEKTQGEENVTVAPLEPRGEILENPFLLPTCEAGNAMRDCAEVKLPTKARENLNEALEQRVAARTAQLQDYNHRLQQEIAQRKAVEKALRKNQQLLRAVLDNSSAVVIYLKDDRGRYLLINRHYETLFEINESDIIGKTDRDIFPEEIAEILWQNDRKVLEWGKTLQFEEEVQQVDGLHTYISIKSPLCDSGDRPYAICGISTDITERKTLEKELTAREKILTAFFHAASTVKVGLCIHDPRLRYLQINSTLAEINGLSVEAHLGKTVEEAIPNLAPCILPMLQAVLDSGQPILNAEVTGEVPSQPGIQRDWLVSYFPIFGENQKVTAVGVIVTEITERKEAERQLKQLNADLARSNQELEQFAYIASHDLREPLRKINSFTELLAERYRGKLDGKADKYIGYITDGVDRMQQLIQDLLTYSRVGRHELVLEMTDLGELLDRTLMDLSEAIATENAAIVVEKLPQVAVNPVQIRQLFQNLIANGIKFRRRESPRIEINAKLEGEVWIVSVCDNGIGVEAQYAERIFAIFQRLHTREEYPGTGIGLAVCKKIVERHGGRIWMESTPGEGTTFYFTLPDRFG